MFRNPACTKNLKNLVVGSNRLRNEKALRKDFLRVHSVPGESILEDASKDFGSTHLEVLNDLGRFVPEANGKIGRQHI